MVHKEYCKKEFNLHIPHSTLVNSTTNTVFGWLIDTTIQAQQFKTFGIFNNINLTIMNHQELPGRYCSISFNNRLGRNLRNHDLLLEQVKPIENPTSKTSAITNIPHDYILIIKAKQRIQNSYSFQWTQEIIPSMQVRSVVIRYSTFDTKENMR